MRVVLGRLFIVWMNNAFPPRLAVVSCCSWFSDGYADGPRVERLACDALSVVLYEEEIGGVNVQLCSDQKEWMML